MKVCTCEYCEACQAPVLDADDAVEAATRDVLAVLGSEFAAVRHEGGVSVYPMDSPPFRVSGPVGELVLRIADLLAAAKPSVIDDWDS